MTRRPRVKICGLTRAEDAELAVKLGADAVGFVFWAGSPRAITADAARAITASLPPFVTRVGVFVNASPLQVAEVVERAGLDAVQLHGDENPDQYRAIARRIIRLARVDTDESFQQAAELPPDVTPIVDAFDASLRGGTGKRADWSRAADLARRREIVLAGGLTPENVAAGIRTVQPWAVDVSSGVESRPGIKSAERLRGFFRALSDVRDVRSEEE